VAWAQKQQSQKLHQIWPQPQKRAQHLQKEKLHQQPLQQPKDINTDMLLREFFYFNDNHNDFANDRRYDASRDKSVLEKDDTRKIKLTLRQINQLRHQTEAHEFETESERGFIKQMYGTKVEAEQPAA
jgi:hypothetical protein